MEPCKDGRPAYSSDDGTVSDTEKCHRHLVAFRRTQWAIILPRLRLPSRWSVLKRSVAVDTVISTVKGPFNAVRSKPVSAGPQCDKFGRIWFTVLRALPRDQVASAKFQRDVFKREHIPSVPRVAKTLSRPVHSPHRRFAPDQEKSVPRCRNFTY